MLTFSMEEANHKTCLTFENQYDLGSASPQLEPTFRRKLKREVLLDTAYRGITTKEKSYGVGMISKGGITEGNASTSNSSLRPMSRLYT